MRGSSSGQGTADGSAQGIHRRPPDGRLGIAQQRHDVLHKDGPQFMDSLQVVKQHLHHARQRKQPRLPRLLQRGGQVSH